MQELLIIRENKSIQLSYPGQYRKLSKQIRPAHSSRVRRQVCGPEECTTLRFPVYSLLPNYLGIFVLCTFLCPSPAVSNPVLMARFKVSAIPVPNKSTMHSKSTFHAEDHSTSTQYLMRSMFRDLLQDPIHCLCTGMAPSMLRIR